MKKLFKVFVTAVILAEDEEEARELSKRLYVPRCSVQIEEAQSVPTEWYNDAPLFSESSKTCGEILIEERKYGL